MTSPRQPTELTWVAAWRTLTRLDKILLLLLALCLFPSLLLPAGTWGSLASLASYILVFWVMIRLTRRFLRHIIWRLRNRLLVAYGFIALVPVLLIIVLFGVLLYAVVGQIAIYMVASELDRHTALIVSTAQHIAESTESDRHTAISNAYPILAKRLPGLEILIEDTQQYRYPAGSTIQAPSKDWGDAGGLTMKDGLLYAWAHFVRPDVRVTATMPLTDNFLATLAPNIGEIGFVRLTEDLVQARGRIRLKRSPTFADFTSPRNRLPEKENRLDIEVLWATALPAFVWETPGRVENELMRIRTRPTAVLRTLFTQKVDRLEDIAPALLVVLSIAFLIAEMTSLIIGVSITRTITSAVHDLYLGTERVKEADFSHRIQVKGDDQLAELGTSFNTMTANIERLLVVAKENERLQADLEIAREVQNQLYPRSVPVLKTLRIESLCAPARMVSGDYYDYQKLDERTTSIAIGDVAGKGISAALLMATLQSALRTQIRHCMEARVGGVLQVSTAELVSHLNQHLYANTSPEKYATFCFGVYNDECGLLKYTNAGHLPPILIRKGEPQLLEVNGTVVGAFPFSKYEESQIFLESGDLLLFYTDGITEAENAYGEQFGEDRLLELVRKHRAEPGGILPLIVENVREWTGTPELQDDMTLLLAIHL